VLDGGPDPAWEGAIFGERGAHCKVYVHTAVACAKTAEPIEMPFGMWVRSGSRNHKLHGVQIHPREGQVWRKGSPIVKYRDFLP